MADLAALIEARFGLATEAGRDMEADGVLAQILRRRSFRKFTDEEVPEYMRAILLAAAQSASAKSDLQQYSIIDLRAQDSKDALAELCATDWMRDAPVLLVFCGDIRRAQRIAEMRTKPYAQNTLDSFFNAAVDAASSSRHDQSVASATACAAPRDASNTTCIMARPMPTGTSSFRSKM